jgi:hypothetical protein
LVDENLLQHITLARIPFNRTAGNRAKGIIPVSLLSFKRALAMGSDPQKLDYISSDIGFDWQQVAAHEGFQRRFRHAGR